MLSASLHACLKSRATPWYDIRAMQVHTHMLLCEMALRETLGRRYSQRLSYFVTKLTSSYDGTSL